MKGGEDKQSVAKQAKDRVVVAERAHKDATKKADAAEDVAKQAKTALKNAKKEFKLANKSARQARSAADEARTTSDKAAKRAAKAGGPTWSSAKEGGFEAEGEDGAR